MANLKITDLTADATPASGDLVETVDISDTTYALTGTNKKVTATNLIKKAHGLSDSTVVGVASGTLTSGTDVAIADGGTGQSTKAAAFDALSPMTNAGDIITGGAAGTGTRLGMGSASQQIRVNAGATALEYFTPASSGGQTLVTKVVAASGGDYTTLGAAITAASAGWVIYVTPGTYTETTTTTALNNITIIGGGEATVLSYTNTVLTMSGTNVRIEGIKFTFTTGGINLSGDNSEFIKNHISKSGATTTQFKQSGSYTLATNNFFEQTAANGSDYSIQFINGTGQRIVGNFFQMVCSGSAETINISGGDSLMTGNVIRATSGSGLTMVLHGGSASVFSGNMIDVGNTSTPGFYFSGSEIEMTGNTIITNSAWAVRLAAYGTFTGNYVRNSLNTGKTIEMQTAGNGDYWVISGNNFHGATSSSSGVFANGDYDNLVITGNRFYNYTTGLNLNTAANNLMVTGNNFTGCTTAIANYAEDAYIGPNIGIDLNMHRTIVRMKNNSGVSVNVGDVVIHDTSVAAGDNFTTTTTASDNRILGMATATITNGSYGAILVLGKTVSLKADGTTDIAVGDFLTSFTTAGICRKATAGTLGTTPGDLAFAIALEAYTSNDSNGVIDALLISPRRL